MNTHPHKPADLHIVLTHEAWVLVRSASATWRDFQDEYADFLTSLGPMNSDEVMEMFAAEWPEVLARSTTAIREFAATARDGQTLSVEAA